MEALIKIGLGVATAAFGLVFHYHIYKTKINQISDDLMYHIQGRDRAR